MRKLASIALVSLLIATQTASANWLWKSADEKRSERLLADAAMVGGICQKYFAVDDVEHSAGLSTMYHIVQLTKAGDEAGACAQMRPMRSLVERMRLHAIACSELTSVETDEGRWFKSYMMRIAIAAKESVDGIDATLSYCH